MKTRPKENSINYHSGCETLKYISQEVKNQAGKASPRIWLRIRQPTGLTEQAYYLQHGARDSFPKYTKHNNKQCGRGCGDPVPCWRDHKKVRLLWKTEQSFCKQTPHMIQQLQCCACLQKNRHKQILHTHIQRSCISRAKGGSSLGVHGWMKN